MFVMYALLVAAVVLDVIFLIQIYNIRSKGQIIYGKIVGKNPYMNEGRRYYFDLIEYTRTDGTKGKTRAKIKQTTKDKGFGKTVKLYEFTERGTTKVSHLTIYLHKLYGSILFTLIILGYIIISNT